VWPQSSFPARPNTIRPRFSHRRFFPRAPPGVPGPPFLNAAHCWSLPRGFPPLGALCPPPGRFFGRAPPKIRFRRFFRPDTGFLPQRATGPLLGSKPKGVPDFPGPRPGQPFGPTMSNQSCLALPLMRPPITLLVGIRNITDFPSPTPFGLGLGPGLPLTLDEHRVGTFGFSRTGSHLFYRYSCLHNSLLVAQCSSTSTPSTLDKNASATHFHQIVIYRLRCLP